VSALKPADPAEFTGTPAYRTIQNVVKTRMENKLKEMTAQDCKASGTTRQADVL
jgi:hypothetical protein